MATTGGEEPATWREDKDSSCDDHEFVSNDKNIAKVRTGFKCCTRTQNLGLMVIFSAAEIAIDVIEINGNFAESAEIDVQLLEFMNGWLGSTCLISVLYFLWKSSLRKSLVMLVLFKSLVFATIRVYFVFAGLDNPFTFIGLSVNALNIGATVTMFNFFYYFPLWDDIFVDNVKRRLLVLSTIGLVLDFALRTAPLMLFLTNLDLEILSGHKQTISQGFAFVLMFEAVFLPFLFCKCDESRQASDSDEEIKYRRTGMSFCFCSMLDKENDDGGIQTYISHTDADQEKGDQQISKGFKAKLTLKHTDAKELWDCWSSKATMPPCLERIVRLVLGWIVLSVSQIGFLVIRSAFPVRVVPTKSSCHVMLTKIEHLLRYSSGLCITIIVRLSEDKRKNINAADMDICLIIYFVLLSTQLALFMTEYLETPLFVEKEGWVQRVTDDLGWEKTKNWHWVRHCSSTKELTVDVPLRKVRMPPPLNTPKTPGRRTSIPRINTRIVSIMNATKTPLYYTTLKITSPSTSGREAITEQNTDLAIISKKPLPQPQKTSEWTEMAPLGDISATHSSSDEDRCELCKPQRNKEEVDELSHIKGKAEDTRHISENQVRSINSGNSSCFDSGAIDYKLCSSQEINGRAVYKEPAHSMCHKSISENSNESTDSTKIEVGQIQKPALNYSPKQNN